MRKTFICVSVVTVYFILKIYVDFTSAFSTVEREIAFSTSHNPLDLGSVFALASAPISNGYDFDNQSSVRGYGVVGTRTTTKHTMSLISAAVAQTMIQLNECLYRGDE